MKRSILTGFIMLMATVNAIAATSVSQKPNERPTATEISLAALQMTFSCAPRAAYAGLVAVVETLPLIPVFGGALGFEEIGENPEAFADIKINCGDNKWVSFEDAADPKADCLVSLDGKTKTKVYTHAVLQTALGSGLSAILSFELSTEENVPFGTHLSRAYNSTDKIRQLYLETNKSNCGQARQKFVDLLIQRNHPVNL